MSRTAALIGLALSAAVVHAQPAAERERPEREPEAEPEADGAVRNAIATANPMAVVYFARGEAAEPSGVDGSLEAAAAWLAEHPLRILVVEAHADRVGSWRANLELSQERADSVRERLIEAGADPVRIALTAHGENRPAEAGLRHSRRVVVRGTVRAFYDEDSER